MVAVISVVLIVYSVRLFVLSEEAIVTGLLFCVFYYVNKQNKNTQNDCFFREYKHMRGFGLIIRMEYVILTLPFNKEMYPYLRLKIF